MLSPAKKADIDKDGRITTEELKIYTRDKVLTLSQENQRPINRVDNNQYAFDIIK